MQNKQKLLPTNIFGRVQIHRIRKRDDQAIIEDIQISSDDDYDDHNVINKSFEKRHSSSSLKEVLFPQMFRFAIYIIKHTREVWRLP